MKTTLLTFCILLLAVCASAQTKMFIHQKSGGDIEILFADKPVATFDGDEMVLTTTKTTLRFSLKDLETTSYKEEDIATAIIESVTQLSPDAGPSRIYDINGRLVRTIPAGEPVSFGTLPQGTYIIKNNNSSYKINKAPL